MGGSISAAPQCSDSDVQALAIEISSEGLREKLFHAAIRSHLGTSPRTQGNPTYAQWKQLDNPDVARLIAHVDAQMAELALALDAIRIHGVHRETRKVECAADLLFGNDNKHPVTYDAQTTDDGDLYVNVYGL